VLRRFAFNRPALGSFVFRGFAFCFFFSLLPRRMSPEFFFDLFVDWRRFGRAGDDTDSTWEMLSFAGAGGAGPSGYLFQTPGATRRDRAGKRPYGHSRDAHSYRQPDPHRRIIPALGIH
jgi:hypothetical protein